MGERVDRQQELERQRRAEEAARRKRVEEAARRKQAEEAARRKQVEQPAQKKQTNAHRQNPPQSTERQHPSSQGQQRKSSSEAVSKEKPVEQTSAKGTPPPRFQKTDLSAMKEKALREKAAADQQRQGKHPSPSQPSGNLFKPSSFLSGALPGAAFLNPGLGAALIAGSRAWVNPEPLKSSQPEAEPKQSGGFLAGALNFGKQITGNIANVGKTMLGATPAASLASTVVKGADAIASSPKQAQENSGWFGKAMNFGKNLVGQAKSLGKDLVAGTQTLGQKAATLGSQVVDGAKRAGQWIAEHKDIISEVGHTALDVAGFIPGVGTVADLANAAWYAAEGRHAEAAASAMSAIPGIGDAFAAGKMGVKLATKAPKAMSAIKTATHLAPMLPSVAMAGNAAMQGDMKGAALTLGTSVLPMAGGQAGQRLLGNAAETGSKTQAFMGHLLAKGSGAAPNAVGATQAYQAYQAYQQGEGSGWEAAKSMLYAGMPFATNRLNRKPQRPELSNRTTATSDRKAASPSDTHQPERAARSERDPWRDAPNDRTGQSRTLDGQHPNDPSRKPPHDTAASEVSPERQQMRQNGEDLRKSLPKRQQVPVEVDPSLQGNTVRVHYVMDKKGQVTDVHIKAGPEATATDIKLHSQTVKRMQQYSGLSRHVQRMKDQVQGWISKNGTPSVGSKAWEAQLEIDKLPKIIEERAGRLQSGGLDEKSQQRLETELADLKQQLATHQKTLKTMDRDPGRGFVAAEGFPEKSLPDPETVRRDQIAHGGWYSRKHQRRLIHEAEYSAHNNKHLRAKTSDQAQEMSTKAAQYSPDVDNSILEKTALFKGHLVPRPGGAFWKIHRFDDPVGFDGGKETHWVRAEYSSGIYHGHPMSVNRVKKYIENVEE
jgi:hypothetical protein